MQISKRKFIIIVVAAYLAGGILTAVAGLFINGGITGAVRVPVDEYELMSRIYEKYVPMEKLYQNIESDFYRKVDDDALMNGAYKGMVSALDDPYSAYLTAEEYNNWKSTIEGEYSGVGITFSQTPEDAFVIVSVQKDTPAYEAGIKAGDIIISADDKVYDNSDKLATAIKGEAGTKVKLVYSREGRETEVTLTRAKIKQHSVSHKMLDENTAYIEITSFIESTAGDFRKALKEAERDGADKLVLDLRDNGGGLVDSCIDVADEFLDEGVVVSTKSKKGQGSEYRSKNGKTHLKTVVLVNKNSASAAEILAAALKDNGFQLVGQTTFGKGVIQSTGQFMDGAALKLTILEYFSPKGNAIHEKGVEPTVTVDGEKGSESDPQLEKARELLK